VVMFINRVNDGSLEKWRRNAPLVPLFPHECSATMSAFLTLEGSVRTFGKWRSSVAPPNAIDSVPPRTNVIGRSYPLSLLAPGTLIAHACDVLNFSLPMAMHRHHVTNIYMTSTRHLFPICHTSLPFKL
jgi:hypothetical protein